MSIGSASQRFLLFLQPGNSLSHWDQFSLETHNWTKMNFSLKVPQKCHKIEVQETLVKVSILAI